MTIDFSKFYRYDELTDLLQGLVNKHPDLLRIDSMGESYEGRQIWVLTLTRFASGRAEDKPALWVDGNIHAAELLASTAVLYFLDHMLRHATSDPTVCHLLDTRSFYLVPRLCPDGAELALGDRPRHIRSSTRAYPFEDSPLDGMVIEDIDGDGRILSMRIADPNGGWKPHPEDPRVMIPREPGEIGGSYYRILPEGRVLQHNGVEFKLNPDREGLDLNRNFPSDWRQEYKQPGAGPYPTSEPEVRAMVDFVCCHPNIGAAVSFHTHSGVILRPMGTEPDDKMIPEDLWMYKRLSAAASRHTGYPAISIWHDFKYHPQQVISGTQDWIYEHLGALFWVVELWAPNRAAGIEKYSFIDWYREHPPEDDLKLLKWSDEVCGGQAHVDWRAFSHPQLGPVEIGGWDRMNFWRNPPAKLREAEVARFPAWLKQLAGILPKLVLLELDVACLGDTSGPLHPKGAKLFLIRMAVENSGYLPSYVSRRALERKTVRGVIFEFFPIANPAVTQPDPGHEIVVLGATECLGDHDFSAEARPYLRCMHGSQRVEGPSLEGHAAKQSLQAFLPDRGVTAQRCLHQWQIAALPGTRVELIARTERAGRLRQTVVLE
ncbi:MAG: carboxypeptidase [Betaproteobacteria bacterium]|nr:carboxypeptidase [Betaproteobacteria bacterium]NBP38730.1 carboxypeptidase [Betaproteobacteria bacterium]